MRKISLLWDIRGFLFGLSAVACVVPAAAQPTTDGPPPLDPIEMRALTTIAHIVQSCDAYRADHNLLPGPTDGFVGAEFLRPLLSPVYIAELPTLDGWGGELRYASDGARMAIVSHGPDGLADRAYLSLDSLQPSEGEGDDLVWADGHFIISPAHIGQFQRLGGQKQTMASLRSIATAVEAFRIDNGMVPGPTEGYVPVATIRSQIEPSYIRTTPLADAWGNRLLYWSDGESYRIASPGWNGTAEQPYADVVPGTTTNAFDADIVFGDGQFLQWPEGAQR